MKIVDTKPVPTGKKRVHLAKKTREAATQHHTSLEKPLQTIDNGDESDFHASLAGSFTKGLEHDAFGFADKGEYQKFVSAINQDIATNFNDVTEAPGPNRFEIEGISWRGWESPRTGHYHSLQGADADAVGMAPAPKLGSDELAAEMAEVYAMAMLRDVPFAKIADGTGVDPNTGIDVGSVLDAMSGMAYFGSDGDDSVFSKRRRAARLEEPENYDINHPATLTALTSTLLFRGSGPGAKSGPFVSQFMLVGNDLSGGSTFGAAPMRSSTPSAMDGYISYGNQLIDQRVRVFHPEIDFMTGWHGWHDVQRGANVIGRSMFDPERRFIATPRHLATYVRFDALYQAYLNACLILIGVNAATQADFPDKGLNRAVDSPGRTGFASFGGPQVLSLVTEVATRCLKFARRQKFNFHRRARPERIGGLLTVGAAVTGGAIKTAPAAYREGTKTATDAMLSQLQPMLDLVHKHNAMRKQSVFAAQHPLKTPDDPEWFAAGENYLLPMAFAEGSPMHPAYAAGHATVAGGCVTMLKAFFKTVDDNGTPVPWSATELPPVVSDEAGLSLVPVAESGMTIEGELNKLAANISIGRNMAGVHYYSDYYDSLRMGERVAVSILVEQAYTYDEPVRMVFRSFDGDLIEIATIASDAHTPSRVAVTINTDCSDEAYRNWWFRHMPEPSEPEGGDPELAAAATGH
ncbi:MAG: bromoperoxidase [Pseudomonadota bacterium]